MIRVEDFLPAEDGDHKPGTSPANQAGGPASPPDRPLPLGPLIDVGGVAVLLSCSTKHVRRMADAGRCPPPIRLGGLVRWSRKVVEDWIAAGCPPVRTVRMGGRR